MINKSSKVTFFLSTPNAKFKARRNEVFPELFINKNGERIQGDEGKKIIIDVKIVPVDSDFKIQNAFSTKVEHFNI